MDLNKKHKFKIQKDNYSSRENWWRQHKSHQASHKTIPYHWAKQIYKEKTQKTKIALRNIFGVVRIGTLFSAINIVLQKKGQILNIRQKQRKPIIFYNLGKQEIAKK